MWESTYQQELRASVLVEVVMSWEGDSQATAPIGRKASTNVKPVLESIQKQENLALNV